MRREIDPASSMAALFGTRLRKVRPAARLTQTALGEAVRTHSTRINQVERCTGAKPTPELARAPDGTVGADDLLVELWPFVYRETSPDWAEVFMARSARAVVIRQYAASVVPGLPQTEAHARAVLSVGRTLRSAEQLEERLDSRLMRQRRLRQPDGPVSRVVLDESILLRPVGGPDVMRAQLARLLETADDPRITVQVLPFSSGAHGAVGRIHDASDTAGRARVRLRRKLRMRSTRGRAGGSGHLCGDVRPSSGSGPAAEHVT
ncbi:hypothetical protein GCM10010211_49420 [Streptomyces albospinus]|uniref:DUF5753 domain-containing protein n=1 Tax=Streptomyces albospinus TaxID=285515 RepID=A0ABQ2VDH9_9ACTN|nr:hypothetical protein GCM10010211_49420 [Streptomyces albospinus]